MITYSCKHIQGWNLPEWRTAPKLRHRITQRTELRFDIDSGTVSDVFRAAAKAGTALRPTDVSSTNVSILYRTSNDRNTDPKCK